MMDDLVTYFATAFTSRFRLHCLFFQAAEHSRRDRETSEETRSADSVAGGV